MGETWHTTGTTAPLQRRWDDVAARMIAAGSTPISPITEEAVFRMNSWLSSQQSKQTWQPPSRAQLLADGEVDRSLVNYDQAAKALVEELLRIQKNNDRFKARARALGVSVDTDTLAMPASRRQMLFELFGGDGHAEHVTATTVPQARRAASDIMRQVQKLQDQTARVAEVAWLVDDKFDTERVIFAIGDRLTGIEERLKLITAENVQLREDLKKKRTTTAKKGKRHGR